MLSLSKKFLFVACNKIIMKYMLVKSFHGRNIQEQVYDIKSFPLKFLLQNLRIKIYLNY